jgi:hypothetical protein
LFEFKHVNEAEPFLVDKLSSDRFLKSAGAFSNSSMFVAPYPPGQQEDAAKMVDALAIDLRSRGVTATVVNLFDVFTSVLDEQGLWEPYCQIEGTVPTKDFITALKDAADLETQICPRVVAQVKEERAQLLIVTGMGACYPVIRTHRLVEVLDPKVPVLVMFPGKQTHKPNGSTSLDILATPAGEGGQQYRARNIFEL